MSAITPDSAEAVNAAKHKAAAVSVTLPSVLRLRRDGTLFCADGTDLKTYLSTWAKCAKVTEETSINIMRTDGHQREREDAWLFRNMGA